MYNTIYSPTIAYAHGIWQMWPNYCMYYYKGPISETYARSEGALMNVYNTAYMDVIRDAKRVS